MTLEEDNPNVFDNKLNAWDSSLLVRLVMLDMQADKDNGGTFKKTSDSTGTAGDSERVKLLTCGGFDHAVEFLKIETGVAPKLLKGERLQLREHLSRCFTYRKFGPHDSFIKGRANLNLHLPTYWQWQRLL